MQEATFRKPEPWVILRPSQNPEVPLSSVIRALICYISISVQHSIGKRAQLRPVSSYKAHSCFSRHATPRLHSCYGIGVHCFYMLSSEAVA